MINNNVVNFPQLPDASQAKPVPEAPKDVAASSAGNTAQNSTTDDNAGGAATGGQSKTPYYELRLTVDKDPQTGTFIYKAINRYTGEVVSELPHESVMEMQKSEQYQAGSVINTAI
jgi:flagellar protein FlaG